VGRLVLIDLRTGAERTLGGAPGMGTVYSLAFSPSGKTLAAGDFDSMLRVWNVASGALLDSYSGNGGYNDDIRFSPDGSTVYSGGSDGGLVAFDVGGHQRLGQILRWGPASAACWATCFAVNRSDTLMVTNEAARPRMELIDPRTFRATRTVSISDRSPQDGMAFTPDGTTLATTGQSGVVTFWHAPTMTPYRRLRLTGPGDYLQFSPDGRLLATVADVSLNRAAVTLWRWPSLRQVRTWQVVGGFERLLFSPDGRSVLTSSQINVGGGLHLTDVATGRALPVPRFDQAVQDVALSPDGRTIAIGRYDGTVVFWDAIHHRRLGAPLRVAASPIGVLAYSPNGKLLAVTTIDYSETVWNTATRSQVGDPLPSPDGQSSIAQFLPNGDLIEEYNGNAVRWPTDSTQWARFACRVAGRDMTPAEWHDLLPNRPYQHVCPAT
jgi:WD40 repeat protein